MAGGGWVRLGDEKKVPADERASEDMAIEMTETTSRGNTVGAAGAVNGAGDAGGQSTNLGATGPGEYKVYKRRWFGLVQLVLLNIMASWSWLTFSPVATHSARYFGTDETTVNWLSTAFVFANAAVSPIVIYVLHLGPKLSIMTSAILLLIGSWIRFAGSNSSSGGILSVVMFGQILTGMAQGFVLCAPTRYSDLWFTTRGRVAATALASLANPFGAALGQLIIPFWVTSPGDISRMVLYVSIISTVVALPSFFIPAKPPTPAAPSSTTPKLSLRASASILIRQLEFWLLFIPFATYVALFNSVSSLLNQIMAPYGYNEEESGIAGALLIVVGLVTAAIASPIIDRTKAFLTAIRIAVPLIGLSLLIFIWMPETRPSGGVAGPYVTMALLGASAFSLVPVAVEFLVELTHPVSPEVTSTLAWGGGQVGGGVFIIISGALKDGEAGDPPFNMKRALIFSAVVALVAVVPPMCLGLFGRGENVRLRRVRSDLDLGRHGIDE
ncbi:major facilitator superfamily domain-containing protein [Immersiella caudata]|uniref:Major facilitator superfamily domain-containing protein n=1 Tax=Immersiella caudata TaxID=314043 RepID=A0AA40BXK3_9PEZI|nr:major facilitator superfamily domain-containing protein [Immersiella caudata]